MPYASAYNPTTFDPMNMGTDGVNSRRTVQPPRPRPTVVDLLAQQQAQQEAEQSANFNAQQQGTPQQVQPLPPVGDPTTVGAPAVELAPPPGQGQQRYGTGTLGGPNVDDRGIAHIGVASPAGRSPLGRKLDEYRARSEASPDSKVTETGWGYEEAPPSPHGPSRLKKALEGFLTMGAMAGANGPTEGAAGRFLGGGIAGGATGAVKSSLMQKFQRDTELGQLRDDIGGDQSIEMKNAQIADEASKPELNSLRIQNTLNEALLRERDREADNTRADRLATATEGSATERARHNKVMENKPSGSGPKEHVIHGQIWRPDSEGVYRVVPGSPAADPSPTAIAQGEKAAARTAKSNQAKALFQKGSEYWNQAQARRKEADAIQNATNPNGTKKAFFSDAELAKIKALTREAEGLEAKTREVQLKGDGLAAEAESEPEVPSPATPAVGKTFNLKAWKADHPNATPTEIEAKRKQYSTYRITE